MTRKIIVAGAGTGSLTHEVQEAISRADAVCASSRFAGLIPNGKKYIPLTPPLLRGGRERLCTSDVFDAIAHESGLIVILVSGDPGIYSLLPLIKRRFPDENITVLPGVSSLQVLCARVGEMWSDAVILSAHGRSINPGRFLNLVERNRLVILFCDGVHSPKWACEKLSAIPNISVVIGEDLGSDSELVLTGSPEEFINHKFSALSLLLVKNDSPFVPLHPRDNEFIRADGVVMTNESVRSVILSRLNLTKDSVLWDIGAGTGSISICAGLEQPESEIHAVEHKPEAVRVIAQNAAKFHLHNIELHESRALNVIESLPLPSHVFIGGSDGEMAGILANIAGLNASVRVIAACVTLETLNTAYTLMKDWRDFEAVQISVAASKSLSDEHILMRAHCPVTLLCASSK